MLNICEEVGNSIDVIFNASKSVLFKVGKDRKVTCVAGYVSYTSYCLPEFSFTRVLLASFCLL